MCHVSLENVKVTAIVISYFDFIIKIVFQFCSNHDMLFLAIHRFMTYIHESPVFLSYSGATTHAGPWFVLFGAIWGGWPAFDDGFCEFYFFCNKLSRLVSNSRFLLATLQGSKDGICRHEKRRRRADTVHINLDGLLKFYAQNTEFS